MKKIFATVLAAIAALGVSAQSTGLEFVDKDGKVIADGSTITVTDIEVGEISAGVYIHNTNSSDVYVSVQYTIKEIPGGQHKLCFPGNCVSKTATGTYESDKGAVAAGATENMQADWNTFNLTTFTETYGTCSASYTLKRFKRLVTGTFVDEGTGPTITVNYVNNDPAGIADAVSKEPVSVVYYDLTGRKTSNPCKGLYIQRATYADGTVVTRKINK